MYNRKSWVPQTRGCGISLQAGFHDPIAAGKRKFCQLLHPWPPVWPCVVQKGLDPRVP